MSLHKITLLQVPSTIPNDSPQIPQSIKYSDLAPKHQNQNKSSDWSVRTHRPYCPHVTDKPISNFPAIITSLHFIAPVDHRRSSCCRQYSPSAQADSQTPRKWPKAFSRKASLPRRQRSGTSVLLTSGLIKSMMSPDNQTSEIKRTHTLHGANLYVISSGANARTKPGPRQIAPKKASLIKQQKMTKVRSVSSKIHPVITPRYTKHSLRNFFCPSVIRAEVQFANFCILETHLRARGKDGTQFGAEGGTFGDVGGWKEG